MRVSVTCCKYMHQQRKNFYRGDNGDRGATLNPETMSVQRLSSKYGGSREESGEDPKRRLQEVPPGNVSEVCKCLNPKRLSNSGTNYLECQKRCKICTFDKTNLPTTTSSHDMPSVISLQILHLIEEENVFIDRSAKEIPLKVEVSQPRNKVTTDRLKSDEFASKQPKLSPGPMQGRPPEGYRYNPTLPLSTPILHSISALENEIQEYLHIDEYESSLEEAATPTPFTNQLTSPAGSKLIEYSPGTPNTPRPNVRHTYHGYSLGSPIKFPVLPAAKNQRRVSSVEETLDPIESPTRPQHTKKLKNFFSFGKKKKKHKITTDMISSPLLVPHEHEYIPLRRIRHVQSYAFETERTPHHYRQLSQNTQGT